MKLQNDNGADVATSNPAKQHSKHTVDCTPKTNNFVAANAVLAGVTAYLARLKFRPLDVVFLAGLICILRFWGAA